jgi:CubicO group peptidase (beta-lactamase class C family)
MLRQLFIVACCLIAVYPASADELVSFPAQPLGVSFPTENWPEFDAANGTRKLVENAVAPAFDGKRPAALERSRALVVIWHGKIVGERYSHGVTPDTRLQSWSMAKSFLHGALGIAMADGLLSPQQPVGAPEWRSEVDARRTITIRQMAQMTDGLDFREQYSDASAGALQMLFGAGRGDVGAFAARSDRAFAPGTHWSYSSGSANILSRMLRDRLGGREAYLRFLRERLFQPLGIRSAVPEFDASGTWISSSYVHATARDYARFGLLYLRGGVWAGQQIVPRDWVNIGRIPTMASRGAYGALFWLNAANPETGRNAISPKLPADMFMARGFGGQFIAIIPSRDAVVVMLNAAYAEDPQPIIDVVANVLDALPR